MAITLAEAKVGMADKVDQQIIDMFRRSSLLLDRMTFDNCISPGTGGSTLAYEMCIRDRVYKVFLRFRRDDPTAHPAPGNPRGRDA